MKKRLFLFCIFFFPHFLFSQNLEKVGKKDMVTVSGGMNYNAVFYNAQGFEARRDPFTWYFNGNLTVNILDVSLPFTYSYSNLHGTYTQPFNMQSCHPKYKWAQAHIGTTAMNFSPYTLAGHIFTGAGIELNPAGFYFAAMYGRLNKGTSFNVEANDFSQMSFKRMGYGVKAGFDKNGNSLTVSFFSAKDDSSSLHFIPAETNLVPQQNSVAGISGKIKFLKCFSAEGEYALSGLTRNLHSPGESTDFNGLEKLLMPTKASTQFFDAVKISAGFHLPVFSLTITHENVDPDYQTFGAYYFNNDLSSWTVAPSFHLLKGKLSLNFNTGWQKNNLDGLKLSTAHRWVGSANVNFVPNPGWNFSGGYSNFTAFTNRRLQTDPFWVPTPADTLSFFQVTQQSNANIIHTFGKSTLKQTISLIGNYQLAGTQQNLVESMTTKVYNGNLSYALQFTKMKFSIAVMGNFNRMESVATQTDLFGPGFQCSKNFAKGIRISAGATYNRSYSSGILKSNILNSRAQLSYSPKLKKKIYGKPSLGISAVYVNRFPLDVTQVVTGELTATVNLGISF